MSKPWLKRLREASGEPNGKYLEVKELSRRSLIDIFNAIKCSEMSDEQAGVVDKTLTEGIRKLRLMLALWKSFEGEKGVYGSEHMWVTNLANLDWDHSSSGATYVNLTLNSEKQEISMYLPPLFLTIKKQEGEKAVSYLPRMILEASRFLRDWRLRRSKLPMFR